MCFETVRSRAEQPKAIAGYGRAAGSGSRAMGIAGGDGRHAATMIWRITRQRDLSHWESASTECRHPAIGTKTKNTDHPTWRCSRPSWMRA